MNNYLSPEVWTTLTATGVALLTGIVTFFVKWLKSHGKVYDLKGILDVINQARKYVVQAEARQSFTGGEKLALVLGKLTTFCQEKEIDLSEVQLKEIVEDIMMGHNELLRAKGMKSLDKQIDAQNAQQFAIMKQVPPISQVSQNIGISTPQVITQPTIMDATRIDLRGAVSGDNYYGKG